MNAKFEGAIAEYPEEFRRCRRRKSHAWGPESDFRTAFNTRGRLIEFTEILTCISCNRQKYTKYSVSRSGHPIRMGKPFIDYGTGYLVTRGHPLATDAGRDAMLMTELQRALERRVPEESSRAILRAVGG